LLNQLFLTWFRATFIYKIINGRQALLGSPFKNRDSCTILKVLFNEIDLAKSGLVSKALY
jgi:hypothetical protein